MPANLIVSYRPSGKLYLGEAFLLFAKIKAGLFKYAMPFLLLYALSIMEEASNNFSFVTGTYDPLDNFAYFLGALVPTLADFFTNKESQIQLKEVFNK